MLNNKKIWIFRILLLIIAICFFTIGLFDGQAQLIFNKAINICMECVGLG